MFEGSDSVDTEGVKTESSLGSSVSACKKVLCSNSVLDSSEYWMRNSKTLCRVDFLEAQHDRSCTVRTGIWTNTDMNIVTGTGDGRNIGAVLGAGTAASEGTGVTRWLHGMAAGLLSVTGGPCKAAIRGTGEPQVADTRTGLARDVRTGLISQYLENRKTGQNRSVILSVSKIKECLHKMSPLLCVQICFVSLDTHAGDQHDNSCHKKLASVSPHLPRLVECLGMQPLKEQEILLLTGLDSPDTCQHDPVHTQSQRAADVCLVQTASGYHATQPNIILQINKFLIGLKSGQDRQHHSPLGGQCVADDDTNRSVSSIEEDFLTASEHLGDDSEDDPFRNDAVDSVSGETAQHIQSHTMVDKEDSEDSETLCASSKSNKLSGVSSAPTRDSSTVIPKYNSQCITVSISGSPQKTVVMSQSMDEPPRSPDNCEAGEWTHPHRAAESPIRNTSKPVELALACAASVIGTISTPHVIERLTLETGDGDDVDGALAIVDSADAEDSEGISMDTFRANVAEVLLREASAVLIHKQSYTSIANFLETTNNKIMSGITRPKRKINDISKCYPGSSDRTEGKVSSTVHTDDSSNKQSSTEKFSSHMCMKENEARKMQDEREGECIGKESCRPTHSRTNIATDKEISDMQGPLEDLATTVRGSEVPEGLLLPCPTAVALHRKETQNGGGVAKKHRPPRLSEIKRKTEEQPELMERLVNPRIMNCPELNVVDMSKPGQPPRNRLQCERWSSRGKAASYESIPEEDPDLCGVANTLGPGSRLGQNLSRGSSISKQSSCESISDEFSRFMVNQMETEGRGFDLLLDYYAGKNASNILASAVQQAASRKNGHLNVRTSSCLSKQSSTESITEEFYRFMLRDMDKENKNCGIIKTKEWSNSLLPPIPRTPFCIRQSSVPDRRSSDSRLTVNSPIKANSFDGFARNSDSLNIYPSNCVSSTGLCKSDSCLYKRAHTDHITDMLIHETWASSIESLMRKNKIITEPSEDSMELDSIDTQPHVQLFANRLASEIVESGKSLLGGQQDGGVGKHQQHSTVGERRQGFKQSRPGNSHSRVIVELQEGSEGPPGSMYRGPAWRGQREVPLIHIEPDQRDERSEESAREGSRESHIQVQQPQRNGRRVMSRQTSSDMTSTVPTVPSSGVEGEHRSFSTSSEESSSGSWAQVAPDEDPQEETTSSFIQLSEGNGNSSASSLGLADLEGFPEGPGSTVLISEERERNNQEQADEVTSGLSTAGSSCQRELLVVNFDLEKECVDEELRAALQWIAASELGIPVLYYRKQEHTLANFQRVVHLAGERAWHVGDLFSLVAQFYQLHHNGQQAGVPTPSLFDWLLKTQH
ncbi:hypothetical protein P4O66_018610 [Electrophorus voltai]|uniref:A-kinase anchor 110kDa C-terminal domain-containing protein n=1 Tax=Electrophorus voltai TaxID=2609070 RepID=A0AAD8YQZ5_9TELE|nr:hypothetical protein P4O66_018610 [Electrophorus voltai]